MLNHISLSRIDLNLLVLFQTVLEEGHVGRAAGRLNLTASAVSHSLGRLRHLLNDPLFLRTPKGVVPTARALELGEPVADILARVGRVIASAVPFDAATSSRRFVIGAPDAVMASLMVPLLERLSRKAPRVDISLIHLMSVRHVGSEEHPWQASLRKLERREIDIAMLPLRMVPARFEARKLYEEDFVVAMRKGHVFACTPTLPAFCSAHHLLVSLDGSPHGFVDELLAKRGLQRRIALTVPTFMMALAHLSSSDLIAALPRRLVERHAARFALAAVELPLKRKADLIQAVATKAATMDAGIGWLMQQIGEGGRPRQHSEFST
ncbi:LysR family transcriptional regulator [Bradyrhizobium sp. CCBAU 11430]|uniref:LysR family transcriptional regulator n=1 Tax=Bradyrhizobium sp. CCBAU 11430 TaxID=1630881 RepID=UPI00230688BA|nr:LysR family transcriptional regulator [Bradyrhizobium sp. CCBAU 11430]MDA9512068.1 LysR family transcriptional regulator [Bradyrhizobium sp. CCBAU 11430]